MDLLALLQDVVLKLAQAEALLAAEKKASFDAGFAAGVASVSGGSDKIYSQEELDAAVAAALAPVKEELVLLKEEIAQLKAAFQAEKDKAVADALVAFKAALAKEYADRQVVESELETGFAMLLK